MIVSFCATWSTIVSVLTSKNILTIMKQFSDLTTDTKFYYRGSKVSFTSIFLEIIASE